MKKTFIKVTLFSLLAFGATSSLVSCKDYDDDITKIGQVNDDQAKQLAALETAVKAAQAAADAAAQKAEAAQQAAQQALTKGDQALAAAQAAEATAARAEQAANQAKADAIKAAMDAVEAALKNVPSQEDLDKLSTKISAIETNLDKLGGKVDEVEKSVSQMQIQIDALNKFKAEIEKLPQALKDIANLQDRVKKVEDAITKINESIININTNVSNLKETIDDLAAEVAKIEPKLVTFITGRLTSVTLAPELYVDGIETIEFVSLNYQPMSPSTLKRSGDAIIVSTEFNPVYYRLNPTSTALTDIDADNMEFVALAATSRGVVEAPIAYVKGSAEISQSGLSKGIMSINAKKTITGSLNDPLKNGQSIYTVALRVPIAAKHLQDASVPEYVYSEYSRIQENTLTPEIAALPWAKHSASGYPEHYSDSATIWNASVPANALVSIEEFYNKEVDLYNYVTGCLVDDNHSQITKEDLKKYGITFRFGIPTKVYDKDDANGTDQQKFVKFVDGSKTKIQSKTPAGLTDNRAAVDKQPIIRVCMVDTINNKLVDQRYLKVLWKNEVVPPVTVEKQVYTSTLSCDDQTQVMTWEKFINDVYAVIDGEKPDMSYEQFQQVYLTNFSVANNVVIKKGDKVISGTFTMFGNPGDDGDANKLTWTLTPEQIGQIVYLNGHDTPTVKDNVFTATVTFNPIVNSYPVITLPLEWTVNLPAALPAINGYYGNYWVSKYTNYAVYPIQYKSKAQNDYGNTVCAYHNNLMNGFTFADYNARGRFIVKNLSSCATWDLQFCKSSEQPAGYTTIATEPDETQATNIAGYNMYKGTELAANLEWPEDHTSWCGNGAHNETYVNLTKNAAGIGLLNGYVSGASAPQLAAPQVDTKIGVWATLNAFNYWPVYFYSINFVKPLSLDDVTVTDHFIDGVVDGSSIDMAAAFQMTDCFGYTVAKTTTGTTEKTKWAADLYKYYEVQDPVYDLKNIRFGLKVENNNVETDPNATWSSAMTKSQLESLTTGGVIPSITQIGDKLVFTSNMGSQVTESFYIWIPVTVTYGWGAETANVKIEVKPMAN